MNIHTIRNELRTCLWSNDVVLAVMLAGSRVKLLDNPDSDIDVYIIIKDVYTGRDLSGIKDALFGKEKNFPYDVSNQAVQPLQSFKTYAEIGTPYEWDRYNMSIAEMIFDRSTGNEITKLLEMKKTLQKHEQDVVISIHLSRYISNVYRSFKSLEKADRAAALLDSAESIDHMLWTIFAFDNRVRPYNAYLEWELANHPPEDCPWGVDEFPAMIQNIIKTASSSDQRMIFSELKKRACERGYEKYFNDWSGNKLALVTQKGDGGN